MPQLRSLDALLVACGAFTTVFLAGHPVSAHSEYDHSDPADGATVATAPTSVRVAFTEELQLSGSSLRVNNGAGQQIDDKDAKLDPNDRDRKTMIVTLPANLPAGTYKVLWKTTSAEDGDTDEGDLSFTVRAAVAPSPAAVTSAPAPPAAPSAAPVAKPAGQPSPSPQSAPLQAPQALPRTGDAAEGSTWLWLALGAMLVGVGLAILGRRRVPGA